MPPHLGELKSHGSFLEIENRSRRPASPKLMNGGSDGQVVNLRANFSFSNFLSCCTGFEASFRLAHALHAECIVDAFDLVSGTHQEMGGAGAGSPPL